MDMRKDLEDFEFNLVNNHVSDNSHRYEIEPIQLSEWLKNLDLKINLIDVRESYEREIAHINGVSIPLSEFQIEKLSYEKNEVIVVYCKLGGRSLKVVKLLRAYGYKNVYSLKGGIIAWSEKIDSSIKTN